MHESERTPGLDEALSSMDETPAERAMDTARLEAFSDGVFAVAITLLILNIVVPDPINAQGHGVNLAAELLARAPSYFAYIISFLFILIMWINHHTLFRYIVYSDQLLLLINGLLLMCVVAVPFSTSLLSTYLQHPEQTANVRTAALVFHGMYFIVAVFFNILWLYAIHERRLIAREASQLVIQRITKGYRFGPSLYLIAIPLTFFSVPASLAVNVGLAVFFATLPLVNRR